MRIKIIGFFLIFAISTIAQAQKSAVDKYFQNYQDSEDFSVVFVSPKMFEMATKVADNSTDKEVKDIIKDIKGLKILTSEKNGMKYYQEALKKIPMQEYEILLTMKEKDNNIRFLTKEKAGSIEELLMLIGGADGFTMLSFTGNLDLDKISKLAGKMNITGAEHLDKVEKKKK